MPIEYCGTHRPGKPVPNPMLNWVLGFLASDPKATDEQVGKEIKIRGAAVELVAYSFGELEKIRRVSTNPPEDNNAR